MAFFLFFNILFTVAQANNQSLHNDVRNTFSSNLTSNSSQTDSNLSPLTYALIVSYIFLIIITVSGNILVILAFFKEPALQVITNYWIVSLSLTDIILASSVLPLQVHREIDSDKWTLGDDACDAFVFLDVLCCTCSIYHLALISLDRYFSIRFPIRYPAYRTPRKTMLAIALTWLWCTLISMPRYLGWRDSHGPQQCQLSNIKFMLFSSLMSFYIPLFLIICFYIGIYRATKARARKFARELASSRRLRNMLRTDNSTADSNRVIQASTNLTNIQVTALNSGDISHHLQTDGQDHHSQTPGTKDSDDSTITQMGDCADAIMQVVEETTDEEDRTGEKSKENASSMGVVRRRFRSFIPRLLWTGPPPLHLPPTVHNVRRTCSHPTPTPHLVANDRNTDDLTQHTPSHKPAARRKSHEITSEPLMQSTPSPKSTKSILTTINLLPDRSAMKSRAQSKLNKRRQKQEARAARIVMIVLGAFVVFWAPFFLINIIDPCMRIFFDSTGVHQMIFKAFVFWGYVNSAVNPFIYTFFNRTFKRAIYSVIVCEKRHRSACF